MRLILFTKEIEKSFSRSTICYTNMIKTRKTELTAQLKGVTISIQKLQEGRMKDIEMEQGSCPEHDPCEAKASPSKSREKPSSL